MQIRVAVIGAGSWGTTVAHLTAHNAPTVLWARDEAVASAVDAGEGNPKYLAGYDLHADLRATSDLAEAVRQADVLVMGVPSHSFRSTLEAVSDHVRAWVPVISLTKGLEQGSKLRMTQVIREVLPGHPYGVLTGPNLAKEILAGDAAATVIAASDDNVAARLQDVFATDLFRVYTNRDIVGCELGGALKNVMAIASGMADGLGTGDNTRAAVISLTKGLEQGSKLRMTQVIREVLPGHPYGVLTGPNLAKEILAGDAAATVIAASDDNVAARLQDVFATDLFRVYTNRDIVGCELGGALKNVMAIASGMADGLGTGDNTRAAVITRGLAELSRLGLAMGGELITFAGLAGMGDLLATCISPQSRNRHVGVELGKGRTIDEVIESMHMVAEGVKTSSVVMELARERDVEMPIAEQVYAVINEGRSAAEAYRGLLGRRTQAEMHDMRA